MSEFKKWWCAWTGSDKLPENTDIRYAFEAGQQSQQAKIDELQARVDGALKHLDLAYPESWGYCVDQSIDILKGNKDEN